MSEEQANETRRWVIFWRRYWLTRVALSPRIYCEPFRDYPQTWYYMPHWKAAKRVCQRICGVLTGHELSRTEWGYGGGDNVDRNCRWCDKLHQVPISEARFVFPLFEEIRPDKWGDFQ